MRPRLSLSSRGLARFVVLCAATLACRPAQIDEEPAPPPTSAPWFEEVAEAAGIDFVQVRSTAIRFWFPEIMSGGGAWLDYDHDGDLDLYLVQGGEMEPETVGGPGNRMFRNEGDGSFVEVTQAAGVGDRGYGMGAAVGDFDADGAVDLYVTNLGPNVLYRNRGDGSFEVETRAGTDDDGWGSSAAFVDIDQDRDLDLYVVNYVNWSPETEVECFGVGGGRDYCHPNRYMAPAADTLYRNSGDRTFSDVSQRAGIRAALGNGLGVAITDFDGDGRVDIFVANDGMPNQLWMNRGGGRFVDEAVPRGCAVNLSGSAEAGMGLALADVDLDGSVDLFLTHLRHETNTLYLNRGGLCEDATASLGLAAHSVSMTGFGTGFADFDHDGSLDLWVSNGRVTMEGEPITEDRFAEPNQLYRGLSSGRFEPLEAGVSGAALPIESSRATAFADYDADGDVDVLVVNNGGRARLFRNRGGWRGGWAKLRLLTRAGSPAIGARARATARGSSRALVVSPAYSYCSSNDPDLHLGLGESERLDEVRIEWPSGDGVAFSDLPANRSYVVRESG